MLLLLLEVWTSGRHVPRLPRGDLGTLWREERSARRAAPRPVLHFSGRPLKRGPVLFWLACRGLSGPEHALE